MSGTFSRIVSRAKTAGVGVVAAAAAVACFGLATPAQAAEVYNYTCNADGNDWTYSGDLPSTLNKGDQVNITFNFSNQQPHSWHGNRILLNKTGDVSYNEGDYTVTHSYGNSGTLSYTYEAPKDTPITVKGWNVEQLYHCHEGAQVASVVVAVNEVDYSITYVTNGGTALDPTSGTALPAELPTTTREGANFEGWYTDAACTVAAVPGAEITQNTTLYAKWSHEHAWVYSGHDGVFTAYCENDVLADECEHNGEKNALKLTIKDYQNPFSDEEKAAWEAAGLTLPALSYHLSDGTLTTPENSGAASEGALPTKSGKYALWVFYDGAVATYDFEISEPKKEEGKTDSEGASKKQGKDADKKDLPQTGDATASVAALLGAASAALAAGLVVKAKRQ